MKPEPRSLCNIDGGADLSPQATRRQPVKMSATSEDEHAGPQDRASIVNGDDHVLVSGRGINVRLRQFSANHGY